MNKRISSFAVLVLFVGLVVGCGPQTSIPAMPTPTVFGESKASVTENPATEVPSQQAPVSGDECGNPYYPVVNGAEWTYTGPTGQFTHTLATGDNGAFTDTVKSGENTFIIQGLCLQGGDINLLDTPGNSLSFSGSGGSSTMKTTKNDGVSLPGDIQKGDDWSQTIGVEVSAGNRTMDFTIDTTFTAVDYETITVPAGTFNALKVVESSDMGGPEPTMINLWYVQNVGSIKTEIKMGDQTLINELVSYNIP
jgi:hypothetical protein